MHEHRPGQDECSWYRPGDGISGGSIVAVGTTTVGYLHQGRNWVVCQQRAATCATPRATATTGSAGRWPTTGAGAGPARSTPSAVTTAAASAAGRRTATAPTAAAGLQRDLGLTAAAVRRRRRTRPRRARRPAVDADRDGHSPPADCDDTNSRVYPAAPEVANDAIDQDCNGADAAGLLSAVVAFRWREGNTTRVNSLRVTEAPAGATVTVTCAGRRKNCPRTRSFTTSAKGSVSLTRMFRRPLRSGAVVTVTVTAPNTVGRVKRYTIRKGRPPRSQTLCLVPGAATPSRC